MKKINKSQLVLLIVFCSITFCYANIPASLHAQNETTQIIVTVVNGRVRNDPGLKSTILKEMNLGSHLTKVGENKTWYKVELAAKTETEEAKLGWISKTIAETFNESKPDRVFQKIADKYLSRKSLNFQTAKQLFEFLDPAADDAKTYETGGDLRLKRLLALSKAVSKIKYEQKDKAPYKAFIQKNESDVIYHEPAGMWIVKSAKFWDLHQRYKRYKVGEKIAWYAAKNPLPGECEGYVVCHVNYLRVTTGEYLNFYPNGKYSKRALTDITNLLQPIVADLPEKRNYTTVSDISDRAEFNRILSELRTIISKTPFTQKNRTLKQISRIGEGHR